MDDKNVKSLVSVIHGSKSDWDTMQHAAQTLEQFGIQHECRVISCTSHAAGAERICPIGGEARRCGDYSPPPAARHIWPG